MISPRPPLRVLCATNHTYAMPLGVMLVSLILNHPRDRPLEIHVLDNGMTEDDRRMIADSIRVNRADFPMENLHWLVPDMSAMHGLPPRDYISVDAYSRLLAPSVLPQSVERVLYLDCDLVVLTDLSPLFDSPEDSAVWAVRDFMVGVVSHPVLGVFNYAEMGLPPDAPYFNSGVMLMNLRRWREENIAGRILEYLHRYRGLVRFEDQGGLNAVLGSSWTELDPAWNQMQWGCDPADWTKCGFSRAQWRRTMRRPKIVHFAGANKPWNSQHHRLPPPRSAIFYAYLQKTEYRGVMKAPWLERLLGPWWYFRLWLEMRVNRRKTSD